MSIFDEPKIEIPDTQLLRAFMLQDELISCSTGGGFEGGDDAYKFLRSEVLFEDSTKSLAPNFLLRIRNLEQYWQFIKNKFPSYAERREFLYAEFTPLLDFLETNQVSPHDLSIENTLTQFVPGMVPELWAKALDRRVQDPAGAITLARTLLESVCKYILDEECIEYKSNAELPKLWLKCSEVLNLAPSQHTEEVFKSLLGNCQNIVGSLGSLRNRISDSHGQGKMPVRPKPRHAELAVNLAGTMAQFVVATWEHKQSK